VKGDELAPGQYVVVTPEELAALDPVATHTIDIEEFVDLDQIDPIFFDHPYYLVPDARASKPYALLVRAMENSNKVGIARMVMRTKQYLTAIRAKDGALVMATLLYGDEVLPIEELDVPGIETELTERELKMAEQLIESLSEKFDPDKFRDEYRDKVIELIEKKAEGQEIVAQPVSEAPTPVVDLMAALEASLAAAKADAKK
jgi:DNA end-binding protein Ku